MNIFLPSDLPLDVAVSSFIQSFQADWFYQFMQFISFLGNEIPGIVLMLLIAGFLAIKMRRASYFLVLSTLGAIAISTILKHLITRSRPLPDLPMDSFPSGHVLFFMGLFGFLLYLNRKSPLLSLTCLATLILIGFSRIYLGYHWSTDVLASYILGFLWLGIVIKLYNGINR